MSFSDQASLPSNVDTLIHARWILPVDPQMSSLEHHSIAIDRGVIKDVLETSQAKTLYSAKDEVNLNDHVLIPGLINAHGHSAMSLLRGYADDLPLQQWLETKIWPAESQWVSEGFVHDGTELAIAEMLLGGITAFSDMYFFPDQVASIAQKAHIRTQLACPVLDFPTIWAQNADEYINKATQLHDEIRGTSLISTAFGPHAPYTVSDEPLTKIAMYSAELDIPIHIHVHENKQEIEDSLNQHGLRPLERLKSLGLLSPSLQTVHMTQLTNNEIELLAENRVNVVHCPSSNLKLASGVCPVSALLDSGINVALGTDSAASNNDLDLINEMHLASLIAKMDTENAETLPARTALKMATINGAKCLGLDSITGSLEIGKQADITAINLNYANSLPVYEPCSTVVNSARSSQVSHVWVAGNCNVSEGQLLTLDLEDIIEKTNTWSEKITGTH